MEVTARTNALYRRRLTDRLFAVDHHHLASLLFEDPVVVGWGGGTQNWTSNSRLGNSTR